MRKNVTQITYDRRAPFIYPGSRDTSAWKKETRYDLDFGRRGRHVLHNSRYAACDVVDIHSGVRRALPEPRAESGYLARRLHRSRRCDGRVIPNASLSFVSSSTNRSSRLDWAGHDPKSRFC